MSTCDQLDFQWLGSWPTVYAQNFPGTDLAHFGCPLLQSEQPPPSPLPNRIPPSIVFHGVPPPRPHYLFGLSIVHFARVAQHKVGNDPCIMSSIKGATPQCLSHVIYARRNICDYCPCWPWIVMLKWSNPCLFFLDIEIKTWPMGCFIVKFH